jgi:Tfp pilus assembly protein FimV
MNRVYKITTLPETHQSERTVRAQSTTVRGNAGDYQPNRVGKRPNYTVRRAAATVALAGVVGGGVAVVKEFNSLSQGPKAVDTNQPHKEYVTQPGDTMWDIAKSAEPNRDVRDVVDDLVQDLPDKSVDIFPGQVIPLPEDAKIGSEADLTKK